MASILIHYDVSDDYVLLETFVRSARAAERTVKALNAELFNGELEFELVILAPESGSLKQLIGIALKGVTSVTFVVWAVIQVMDSDSVREISEELFGKTPSQAIVDRIRRFKEEKSSNADGLTADLENEARLIVEDFVSRSAQRGLELPRDKIAKLPLSIELKYEFEAAQSDLFGGALRDASVRAIGFDEEDDFPIKRNQFAERAVIPQPPREEEIEEDWRISIQRLRVTSPNFDKDDQAYRKWKAKGTSGVPILFEIRDEEFWQNLKNRSIEFSETTEIEVQIATLFVKDRASKHVVIRVLKLDSKKLAEPLSEEALKASLGEFAYLEDNPDQGGLLDLL